MEDEVRVLCMRSISKIHPSLEVVRFELASTLEDVKRLQRSSPTEVPRDYAEWVQVASELEIVDKNATCCFRVWDVDGCLEMNEAYDVKRSLPGALAVGDNEAGALLVYLSSVRKPGLYRVSLGDMDVDSAVWIAESLDELLFEAKNVELLV